MSKFRILENIFIALLLINIISCSEGIKTEAVNSMSINNNPLQVSITISTEMATDAYIEYWPSGSDSKSKSDVSSDKLNHKIELIGLTSNSDYKYYIQLKNDEIESKSKEHSFITGSLPEHIPHFDLVVGNEDVFDGFLMLRKMDDPGTQIVVNNKGEIVWYQVSDSVIFRPFSITSDNTYLALKGPKEIIEMNYFGDTILYFNSKNGFKKKLHHEIFKNDNKQIVVLTKEEKIFDLTEFGGSEEVKVVGDGILILDTLGNTVWSWNMFDAMDIEPSKKMYQTRGDWSHGNALSLDTDNNFLISFRNFNQIWKIDATDGHVIWKLGDNGDITLDKDDHFRVQHAVHINPNGNIMLFDNIHTVGKSRSSRAIAFKISDATKTAEKTLEVSLPDSLYSFKQGNVNFISPEKLLFCSSMSKRIAITNLEGTILWQLNSNQSFYRVEYIPLGGKFKN